MKNEQFFEEVIRYASNYSGSFKLSNFRPLNSFTKEQLHIVKTMVSRNSVNIPNVLESVLVKDDKGGPQCNDVNSAHSNGVCDCQDFSITSHGLEVSAQLSLLRESRKSGKSGFYLALTSIFIAIVTSLVSIYFSHLQLVSAVQLKDDQFKAITNSINRVYCELSDDKIHSIECAALDLGIEIKK